MVGFAEFRTLKRDEILDHIDGWTASMEDVLELVRMEGEVLRSSWYFSDEVYYESAANMEKALTALRGMIKDKKALKKEGE